jgi:hypothetical protein
MKWTKARGYEDEYVRVRVCDRRVEAQFGSQPSRRLPRFRATVVGPKDSAADSGEELFRLGKTFSLRKVTEEKKYVFVFDETAESSSECAPALTLMWCKQPPCW